MDDKAQPRLAPYGDDTPLLRRVPSLWRHVSDGKCSAHQERTPISRREIPRSPRSNHSRSKDCRVAAQARHPPLPTLGSQYTRTSLTHIQRTWRQSPRRPPPQLLPRPHRLHEPRPRRRGASIRTPSLQPASLHTTCHNSHYCQHSDMRPRLAILQSQTASPASTSRQRGADTIPTRHYPSQSYAATQRAHWQHRTSCQSHTCREHRAPHTPYAQDHRHHLRIRAGTRDTTHQQYPHAMDTDTQRSRSHAHHHLPPERSAQHRSQEPSHL